MKKQYIKLSIFKKAFISDIRVVRVAFPLLIILLVSIAFVIVTSGFKTVTDRYKQGLDSRDSVVKKIVMTNPSELEEIKKLKQLYLIIDKSKPQYYDLGASFNAFSYTFTIFLIFFSISTGLLGFLIAKKGWDNINNYYLKSSFLLSIFLSSLFGLLPNVFNNKDNTKNNFTKFYHFSGLQMDIYGLVLDNKGYIKSGKADTLNYFVNQINLDIKENQDLYFDIQIDKVSNKYTTEVLKGF